MRISFQLGQKEYFADVSNGIDLSIPFDEHSGARAWGSADVRIEPVRYGDWVGSVKAGSGVNFCDVILNPHGQGTHTECAGHILPERQSVHNKVSSSIMVSRLVSRTPKENIIDLSDVPLPSTDFPYRALVVRRWPNTTDKKTMNYWETNPPYFRPEDLARLAKAGVQHFLTDLPSVDPEVDGGALLAHRAFLLNPQGDEWIGQTITEFVFVPDEVEDGDYLLNLQVAPLVLDAAPSRPVLYRIYTT